jgi:hypothetical protein
LPLDRLEPIDVTFNWTIAPGQTKGRVHSRLILSQALG